MASLTLTAKNQLTLKQAVVKHLGLTPGDKVEVDLRPDGRVELRAAKTRTGKISDAFGMFTRPDDVAPLTIEEMNDVIADGWAERGARGL